MLPNRFRSIKPEIRVLGIDDGQFVPRTKGTVDVVGVVYRGGYWFEGVMRTKITIDGFDATEKIAKMIESSPYYRELRVVVLDGVTFAGFNVVDISMLSRVLSSLRLMDNPVKNRLIKKEGGVSESIVINYSIFAQYLFV